MDPISLAVEKKQRRQARDTSRRKGYAHHVIGYEIKDLTLIGMEELSVGIFNRATETSMSVDE